GACTPPPRCCSTRAPTTTPTRCAAAAAASRTSTAAPTSAARWPPRRAAASRPTAPRCRSPACAPRAPCRPPDRSPHRHPAGARGRRTAQPARELAVRRRLAVGDLAQSAPDRALELGALHGQRGVERPPPAGEVLGQLLANGGERVVVARQARARGRVEHVQ